MSFLTSPALVFYQIDQKMCKKCSQFQSNQPQKLAKMSSFLASSEFILPNQHEKCPKMVVNFNQTDQKNQQKFRQF